MERHIGGEQCHLDWRNRGILIERSCNIGDQIRYLFAFPLCAVENIFVDEALLRERRNKRKPDIQSLASVGEIVVQHSSTQGRQQSFQRRGRNGGGLQDCIQKFVATDMQRFITAENVTDRLNRCVGNPLDRTRNDRIACHRGDCSAHKVARPRPSLGDCAREKMQQIVAEFGLRRIQRLHCRCESRFEAIGLLYLQARYERS